MNRWERGFSLVDVLATVALTGVLAAIAVPTVGTAMNDMRANAGLRAVQGHMRVARDTAIAKRRIIEVQFLGTSEIRSTRLEGSSRTILRTAYLENGMQFRLTPGVPDTPDAFGSGSAVSFSGLTTVFFQPDGSLTDSRGVPVSGTLFLGHASRTLSARAITVLGPTGRVQGYRWDSRTWRRL